MPLKEKTQLLLAQLGPRSARWAFIATMAAVVGWGGPGPMPPPIPSPLPQQEWTAGVGYTPGLSVTVLVGALPPPDPRQRQPPCEDEIGEEAIAGYCWLKLVVKPPCPKGKAWEHLGACYAYALRAEKAPRVPTTGEPRGPGGVAAPPEKN